MNAEPKRPWWRKKRWWAVGLLWLLASYFLSGGPAVYCVGQGWISPAQFRAVWRPGQHAADSLTPTRIAYGKYLRWWGDLSEKHGGDL